MTETNTSSKLLSRPRLLVYGVAMVLLVLIDQWSKGQVIQHLSGGRVVTVLPRLLQFRYMENTGAAFSVLTGRTLFLAGATALILVVAILLLVFRKIPKTLDQVALVLLVAGGAGNLIDRVARHYVVDFIEVLFTDFAVFNFADICVTVGAALLILSTIFSFVKDSGED